MQTASLSPRSCRSITIVIGPQTKPLAPQKKRDGVALLTAANPNDHRKEYKISPGEGSSTPTLTSLSAA